MNWDKIGDVYDGRLGTAAVQEAARQRLHWMCAQVVGMRVLDVGCSQGVASILLGREGHEVVGVDRETVAVDVARARLAEEPEAVRRRVRFEFAEASHLPFEPASFDCVLLGEVLEHQANSAALVDVADLMVRPGGTVVVTVPYGLFRYHDHKDPLYLGMLLDELSTRWTVAELALIDRYIGVSATKPSFGGPPMPDAVPWRRALDLADQRVAAHDETVDDQACELSRLRDEVQALRSERGKIVRTGGELEAARQSLATAEAERQEALHGERRMRQDLDTTRLALARAEAERDEARRLQAALASN